uniref:Ribonuclease P protein subunit p25-like protein n=1 Tax=Callithrix jacchus TaxID=9483 RepID=A0A5F4VU08_CALJA
MRAFKMSSKLKLLLALTVKPTAPLLLNRISSCLPPGRYSGDCASVPAPLGLLRSGLAGGSVSRRRRLAAGPSGPAPSGRARPRGLGASGLARHLGSGSAVRRLRGQRESQDSKLMEHYRKAGSVELPAPSPMPQLPPDTLEMRVRDGSKIRNLLGLALGRLEGGSARHVVFSGSGRAAGKAVSCAEIVKRRVPGLHQLTKLRFLQTEDSWVPTSPDTGLDPLTVRRHVPAVWVLLSRDPLDPNECGYQPPGAPPGLGSMPSSSSGPRTRRRT